MENKKSYYENDSRDMRDFNPRFHDLYQDYSDGQQGNHTFNLNGTIYVHNHHGGEPIPVGKAKSPTQSRSTAKPNRRPSQRQRSRAESAGVRREDSNGSMNRIGTNKTTNRTGARAGQPGIRPSAVSAYPGHKNGSNRQKNPASKMVRGMVVGFVALFFISMIVPILAALMNFDSDGDFSEEDGDAYEDTYEDMDIQERESQPLPQPITEEGVVYLMGGFIRIGATADTLLENYERIDFEPQEPVQPGENYYITLDIGDKYGVGSIALKNMGDKATKDLNGFTIIDVSADYYTEWGEDFDSTRTETDCEIIGGITIGMDYTEALWALEEVCDDSQMLDSSEGNQGHLVGHSEKYYYSITIEDEEITAIAVSLRETEPEQ